MECKASAAVTISESDLSKSVKNLKATKGREHTDSLEYDTQIADKLGAEVGRMSTRELSWPLLC